jgi:tetratricopeptide (TPR) repeat protein
MMALMLASMGRKAEGETAGRRALRLIERQLEVRPDDARALYLGAQILCRLGENSRALEWAKRALDIDPDDTGVLYNLACLYALLGELEKALDCLERAIACGFAQMEWLANDGDLIALHASPRFQSFLARR